MNQESPALLTDLYQLTMAQGYWEHGKHDETACFHMYFRENPFKGGFAVACGMSQLAQIVEDFRFSDEDCAYLASLDAPAGGKLFKPEFIEYLRSLKLELDIDAVYEGTVVFPNEPLVRVVGPILQCQLLETSLLNCVNFQTLIATKAARVTSVSKVPVMEFGLRRAQGAGGGLWASRAAVAGGCASTSNVLAGKLFDLPVSGTHAHSWVMAFDNELESFRAYASSMPGNCVLLIDTYDVEQGAANAITVGLEMRERGERLAGVRIDSGDLAWLSKKVRSMLDDAGLYDCGIVLSNDQDQGVCVNSYGVGTKLATAYDQPSLGGVYKLSAIWDKETSLWTDRLKVTEQLAKLTVPGVLDVRRYFHENGRIAGDMVFDINVGVSEGETIIDPMNSLRRKVLAHKKYESLLHPHTRTGCVVLEEENQSAMEAQKRLRSQLQTLDETQKRMLNPHSYPVGLESSLFERRRNLFLQLRGMKRQE